MNEIHWNPFSDYESRRISHVTHLNTFTLVRDKDRTNLFQLYRIFTTHTTDQCREFEPGAISPQFKLGILLLLEFKIKRVSFRFPPETSGVTPPPPSSREEREPKFILVKSKR